MKVFGLNEVELLAVGAACYFMARGAGQIAALPAKVANVARVDAQNTILGLTNTAGLTNAEALVNEWQPESYGFVSTQPVIFSKNEWGEGVSNFSLPVKQEKASTTSDILSEVQSGINAPGGLLGENSLTDIGNYFPMFKLLGW